MADKIVSWGGIDSKGTTGMGVTGSLAVSGSATITNGATIFNGAYVYNNLSIETSNLPQISLYDSLQTHTWLIRSNGTSLSFIDQGNTRLWIGGVGSGFGGKVGINTASTSAQLTVKGSGATSSTTAFQVQNANASASFTVRDDRSAIFAKELYIDGDLGDGTGSIFLKNSAGDYSNRIGTNAYNTFISTRGTANGIQFLFGIGSGRALNFTGGDPNNITIQPAGASLSINGVNDIVHGSDKIAIESRNYNGGEGVIITRGRSTNLTDPIVTFKYETAEKVRITNNGNVGIGTSNPTASLHISGSSGSVLLEIDSPTVNNILFVSGSGNVGIGTGAPAYQVHISGSGSNSRLYVDNGFDGNYYNKVLIGGGYIQFGRESNNFGGLSIFGNSNAPSMGARNSFRFTIDGSRGFLLGESTSMTVYGPGTTSSTTALLVQNASNRTSFIVNDDGRVGINVAPYDSYALAVDPISGSTGVFVAQRAVANSTNEYRFVNSSGTPSAGSTAGSITWHTLSYLEGRYTSDVVGGFRTIDLRILGWSGSAAETARFTYDNKVGIGTTTPAAKVHISGSSNSILLEIDSPAVNNILYVSGSGNVGINTSSPTTPLFVKGRGNSSTTTAFLVENSTSGSSFSVRDDGVVRILGSNTDAQISFTPSGGTSQINLNSQSVTGTLQTATAGTYAGLGLLTSTQGQNTNLGTSLSGAGGGVRYWASLNGSQHSHIFYHNLAEQMRLSYTGNLIVGISGSDTSRLSVRGSGTTSATTALLVQNANASSSLSVQDGVSVSGFQVTAGNFTDSTFYRDSLWRSATLASARDITVGSDGTLNGYSSRLNFITYYSNGGQGNQSNFAGYVRTTIGQYTATSGPGGNQPSGRGTLLLGVYDSDYSSTVLNSFDVVSVGKYATTISGSLTVSGSITATTPTTSSYVCDGILSGNQTFATGSDAVIQFVDYIDPNNWISGSRFTPTIAGYYNLSFGAWIQNPGVSTNQVNVQMRKNNSTMIICQQPLNNGTGISLGGSRIIQMNGTTDYIDFTVFQGAVDSGTTGTLLQGSANGQGTWFSAFLLTQ
jgi:hypothetical protein